MTANGGDSDHLNASTLTKFLCRLRSIVKQHTKNTFRAENKETIEPGSGKPLSAFCLNSFQTGPFKKLIWKYYKNWGAAHLSTPSKIAIFNSFSAHRDRDLISGSARYKSALQPKDRQSKLQLFSVEQGKESARMKYRHTTKTWMFTGRQTPGQTSISASTG